MANKYETWARSLDQRVLGGIDAAVSDMPRPLVLLVAIASLLGMLIFTRYLVRLTAKRAPPTFEGIPFIGGILKFAKVGMLLLHHRHTRGGMRIGPLATVAAVCKAVGFFTQGPMILMREGYSKCGEVFTVPVLHKNITFLMGPHVTPHFFKARDDQLSQTEVCLCELYADVTSNAALPLPTWHITRY
jgi:sterol 14alpha-demethylase